VSRLTKYHREELERRLLRGRFNDRCTRLRKLEIKLGDMIYVRAFTLAERELLAKLPRGWLKEVDKVTASMNGTVKGFPISTPVRLPYNKFSRYGGQVPLIVVDHQEHKRLYERYEAVVAEERELNKDRDEAQREIRAVLAGLNTAKQVKQHWPEVAHLVDEICPERDKVSRAIVIRTERVNEILGLKSVSKKETISV
jgi:hypothetical protein